MAAGEVRQGGLFDEPPEEEIPSPGGARPAKKPTKYLAYSAKTRAACQDCELLVLEQLREHGTSAHLIRQARTRRVEPGVPDLLLCSAHARSRQENEAAKPRKKA